MPPVAEDKERTLAQVLTEPFTDQHLQALKLLRKSTGSSATTPSTHR
jgi:hypothetical protein